MGTNVNMKPIAHIMWDYAPQLCARLAPAQCDIFPQSKIFVLEQGKWESPEDTYSKNEAWISNLPQGAYSGRLKKSIVIRKCLFGRAITKRISWSLLPSLSVASISRLIVGPRNIMLHGLLLSLVDLLILRCFGKRIVCPLGQASFAVKSRKGIGRVAIQIAQQGLCPDATRGKIFSIYNG